MSSLPSTRTMLHALRARDATFDGVFFAAVRTTGIFCRPSCPARKPKPENVQWFATARQALFSGYRPCRRCHPLQALGEQPAWAKGLLAEIERAPTTIRLRDKELRQRGVEPAKARRWFQQRFGMTFQAYARARRLGAALTKIREGATVDRVILDSGFDSHSGFRSAFVQAFGQPPGKSRAKGSVVLAWIESPFGPLLAGATDDGVCLLEFTDRRMLETQLRTLQRCFRCALVPGSHQHLTKLRQELDQYFAGKVRRFGVPLAYPGTPFQSKVWDALQRIPYGETRTYEDLAREVGSPRAVRAVGRANGQNRIAIVIPCHRVINKGGKLGGYGGGVWRKQRLLELEGAWPSAGSSSPTSDRRASSSQE